MRLFLYGLATTLSALLGIFVLQRHVLECPKGAAEYLLTNATPTDLQPHGGELHLR